MDVLSSRILVRPADLDRSHRFYRDVLGLAVYREFGSAADPGVVFFAGPGLLEVSGRAAGSPGRSVMIWLQVRDVHAEHERLAAAGVHVLRGPQAQPWGLIEMWIADPDGVRMTIDATPNLMIWAAWCVASTDDRRPSLRGVSIWLRLAGSAIVVIRLPVTVMAGSRAESGILPAAA